MVHGTWEVGNGTRTRTPTFKISLTRNWSWKMKKRTSSMLPRAAALRSVTEGIVADKFAGKEAAAAVASNSLEKRTASGSDLKKVRLLVCIVHAERILRLVLRLTRKISRLLSFMHHLRAFTIA